MKKQVTDISKALQSMAEEMRLMRNTINQQYSEIIKLNRNIETLSHQLHKKNEESAKLPNACLNTSSLTRTLATAVRRQARRA